MDFIPVMKKLIGKSKPEITEICHAVFEDLNDRVMTQKETAHHIVQSCREVFNHPYQIKDLHKNPHVIDFIKAVEWWFAWYIDLRAYRKGWLTRQPEFFDKYLPTLKIAER